MRLNISYLIILIFISAISGCSSPEISVETEEAIKETNQEKFIRKLYSKKLISNDSIDDIKLVIKQLCSKNRYRNKISTNSGYNPYKLNFYVIDSRLDSSLRNLCAYAGNNTIFLDKVFLKTYLSRLKDFDGLSKEQLDSSYNVFQHWVIGHEIAHADLEHLKAHFINNNKPKTQEVAREFHGLEFDADKRCLSYLSSSEKTRLTPCLVRIFNSEYSNIYGVVDNAYYLKFDHDPYLTLPYKLDGSHPIMPLRAALMLFLINQNPEVTNEAYEYLLQSQLHLIKEITNVPDRSKR